MSGLDLHLDIISKPPVTQNEPVNQDKSDDTWLKIADMRGSALAVNREKRKIAAIIEHDRKVREAVNLLTNTKCLIKKYGASESMMAFFNQGDQLGKCIGMIIPQITDVNKESVGTACCESIDATVVSAYDSVKDFFGKLIDTTNNFFEKLNEQTKRQNNAIDSVVENIINNAEKVNNKEFSHNSVFGYTQPVFMNRVDALRFINEHLPMCEANNASMLQFAPALKSLGYKIIEKSSEGLHDGETDLVESELQIVPDTAEEPQAAPAPEGGEGGGEQPPAPAEGAPTGNSVENVQVTGSSLWNIDTIRSAALAVKTALVGSEKLSGVTGRLGEIQGTVMSAIEAITTSDSVDKVEAEATIASGRRYASFIGDMLAIYSGAADELVDQIVCMAAKLVATQTSDDGDAPAPEGGGEQPAAPEGGEQQPAAPPEGGAPAQNGVENPENVPQASPVKPNAPVCPNGEPDPGKAPHVQPVETPESQQPAKHAETLIEDVDGTRLW